VLRYKLSNEAKEDLIRIHHYGVGEFGLKLADKYFYEFFDCFDRISENPFAFELVNHIRDAYRRCPCGVDAIYFRIKNNMVEIMTIIAKQDLNTKLKMRFRPVRI